MITHEWIRYRNGTLRAHFVEHPEDAVFGMMHGFAASFLDKAVVNPATTFRGKSGEALLTVTDGSIVDKLTVQTLLRGGGFTLDSPNQQPREFGVPDPFFRYTGMHMMMIMTYTNLRANEFPKLSGYGVPQANVTIETLPNTWGYGGIVYVPDPYHTGSGVAETVPVSRVGVKVQLVYRGQARPFNGSMHTSPPLPLPLALRRVLQWPPACR